MPKNKLVDLNDHLFEELERLNDVASKLIDNGNLILKAVHEQNEYGAGVKNVPKLLLGASIDEESLESRKR